MHVLIPRGWIPWNGSATEKWLRLGKYNDGCHDTSPPDRRSLRSIEIGREVILKFVLSSIWLSPDIFIRVRDPVESQSVAMGGGDVEMEMSWASSSGAIWAGWLHGSLRLHISICCRGSLACTAVDASVPLLTVLCLARRAGELQSRLVGLMVVLVLGLGLVY